MSSPTSSVSSILSTTSTESLSSSSVPVQSTSTGSGSKSEDGLVKGNDIEGDDIITKKMKDEADKVKEIGNDYFKKGDYEKSIKYYSEAIEIDNKSPALYANRAFAYLKTEAYGLAAQDANAAIALDPNYVKAYYRLGSAHLALSKYKLALSVFKRVIKLAPNDKQAQEKYNLCMKEVKRQAFEEAIATEQTAPPSESIKIEDINVPDTYKGPKWDCYASSKDDDKTFISPSIEFVRSMVEAFKNQQRIHKRYCVQILLGLIPIFKSLPSLLDIRIPPGQNFTVCGDVHGQFYDLLNIFALNGEPSETNPYLFNGDFVDRGSFSCEVILTLFAYKLHCPSSVHLLRGNHETKNMNKLYGFDGEVRSKFDEQVMILFSEIFQYLPLSATLNKKVITMHGGLFQNDGVKLEDIAKISRFSEPPESGLFSDILWSDPQPFPGRSPSKRGVGQSFGPDVTKRFLDDNNLDLIVRSHEVRDEGYLFEHNGKFITVFSAPNYCDQM